MLVQVRWSNWDYLRIVLKIYAKVSIMVLHMVLIFVCSQERGRSQLTLYRMEGENLLSHLKWHGLGLLNKAQSVLNLLLCVVFLK